MANFYTFFKRLLSKKEKKLPSKSLNNTGSQIGKRETNNSPLAKQSSIKETPNNYKYNEDGRRYHGEKDVAYVLPNDDEEANRLHRQHRILKQALQCNYHAPVTEMLEEGITVLDSGCGPGSWTLEMGEIFPKSKFHGIDISFTSPDVSIPPNVHFVTGNIAKHIPYPDNTFDYIHQRSLLAGLSTNDWENTLRELYRILKPGGYIEVAELDVYDIINMGSVWETFRDGTAMMFKSRGIPPRICSELEARLTNAGFINQVIKTTPMPLNHGGEIGEENWVSYKKGFLNFKPVMAKVNRAWEDIKVYEKYVDSCGEEARERKTCANYNSFCAQKPFE